MYDDIAAHIPDDAVVLNVLRVVEYLTPDGQIYRQDLSFGGDGDDLDPSVMGGLIAWAQAFNLFPMLAPMIHDYVYGDDDGDEDEEISEVTA